MKSRNQKPIAPMAARRLAKAWLARAIWWRNMGLDRSAMRHAALTWRWISEPGNRDRLDNLIREARNL